MQAIFLSVVLLGQLEGGLPPAPAPELPGNAVSAEEMRNWLLARLIIDMSFDTKKAADVERMLGNMNDQQLRALTDAYKERTAKREQATKPPVESTQRSALDEAKLNLQLAEAYRDHLKREYDRRILQGQMEQNLVRQNLINNQLMMYRTNFGWGYGPLGVAGLGYGVLSYGGWACGAPTFGGPVYGGFGYGGWGYGF